MTRPAMPVIPPSRSGAAAERGATLLVVLVMLVIITLFAVSAINISNVSMKIVGNMQHRLMAEAVAQTAIETALNSSTYYYNPSAAITVTAPTGMTVTVGNRVCLGADAASGYSAAQQIVPEDTYWNIPVTVTDTLTGAATVMNQGVTMRMLAGNCPL